MERKLIEYVPEFLRELKEYKAVFGAEQTEIEGSWNALERLLDDSFLCSASQDGIVRFEKMLGIVPKSTDTLEQRRLAIQVRLSESRPFTFRMLKLKLAALCGEGCFSASVEPVSCTLAVRLALCSKDRLQDADKLLKRIVPANIGISLDLIYNNHEKVSALTHGQLASYTNKMVRDEVLLSG